MQDYGARFYDPQIARFHTQDPHADDYEDISPYAYVENNPLSNTDPDGMDVIYNSKTNTYTINGDDIMHYWGYIQEMLTGGYSQERQQNMYSDLLKGLDDAANKNSGHGGPIQGTLPEVISEGKGTPGFNENSSQNYSLYSPEETKSACNFMLAAAGGEILGGVIAEAYSAYRAYRAAKAAETGLQGLKSLGAAVKGFSGKFPKVEELARRLGTTVEKFHKNIKPLIKKDFINEMKSIGTTNPDIGVDEIGNIVLKNPKTGATVSTDVPLELYK